MMPGRAAAPGRGPGFSQAGGYRGPESPRPGSRASAVGGPRSRAPGATPEFPPSGWPLGPAQPTPAAFDLTRAGGCSCLRVVATAIPSPPPPGRAVPACQFPLPGARPGAGPLPGLVLPGRLLRPPGPRHAGFPRGEHRGSRHRFLLAPSPLLIATGEAIPLRGLEGVEETPETPPSSRAEGLLFLHGLETQGNRLSCRDQEGRRG